jgi:hypothetical protein
MMMFTATLASVSACLSCCARALQVGLHVPEVPASCFQRCIDSVIPGVALGSCLFDSRLHGRSNAAFHGRCDGKGATIGFVFSGSNIFGFVATQSWKAHTSSCSSGIEAPGCRLFSLFRDGAFDPVVFELADSGDRSAMMCSPRIGPGLGGLLFVAIDFCECSKLLTRPSQFPTFASTLRAEFQNLVAAS